jgi:L,D-peptidoglycan transpeptidase YkuD (ErfK/YbiS/YcfS/YnhG family)
MVVLAGTVVLEAAVVVVGGTTLVETAVEVLCGFDGAGSEHAPTASAMASASHRPGALRPRATTAHGSGVTRRFVLGTVAAGLLLVACGPSSAERSESRTTAPAATTPPTAPPTSTALPPTTVSPTTAAPATEPVGPGPTTGVPPATVPDQLGRVGAAGQAVLVTADDYGSTTARLTTWQRAAAGGWEQVHGPSTARLGRSGLAPPGEKREGDGRTPSGTYGFDFLFGVEPDPGVALPYRRVTGPSIVWDDNPSSPTYNLWVDGGVGEAMYVTPAYDYGAVIAYNADRAPGLGSAIFLHVSTGGPTAGCVSLPVDRLLEVLRWLDPARAPVIILGIS